MVPTKNRVPNPLGDEFITPPWVWKPWHEVLNFVIDAAATDKNHIPVAQEWWTKGDSALAKPSGYWTSECQRLKGAIWLNPPYSRLAGPLEAWVHRAMSEAALGATVCLCLPSDTSTLWFSMLWHRNGCRWHDGVTGFFVEGRVRFIHPRTGKPTKNSPNFGTLIAVCRKPIKP